MQIAEQRERPADRRCSGPDVESTPDVACIIRQRYPNKKGVRQLVACVRPLSYIGRFMDDARSHPGPQDPTRIYWEAGLLRLRPTQTTTGTACYRENTCLLTSMGMLCGIN